MVRKRRNLNLQIEIKLAAMSSKKNKLILAVLLVTGLSATAQLNKDFGWDFKDSSKIPAKRMPQFNEFMRNQYPYPAKPRDMYEVGVGLGFAYMFSDLDSRFGGMQGLPNLGVSLHVRKSLSPTWSVRLAYVGSQTTGLDWRARTAGNSTSLGGLNRGGGLVTRWDTWYSGTDVTGRQKVYFANFRNRMHSLNLEFVYSLNNIDFFRANPKWNLYLFGGYSLTAADVDINAKDKNGNPYKFYTARGISASDKAKYDAAGYVGIDNWATRGEIRTQLRNAMDDDFESNATVTFGNRSNFGRISNNFMLRHGVTFGFGGAYKINDKWNVGLEQRFIYAWEDQWDGLGYAENNSNDILGLTMVKLNRNIGDAAKKVQPLWWINPNNYVYQELNQPNHSKDRNPILKDSDGDGVVDQFDLEPNTPAGANVDSHGRAVDSDGDGVPDYKDKEPLTQQKCFPVNADGVGTCPEPACCGKVESLQKELDELKKNGIAKATTGEKVGEDLPSLKFDAGSSKIKSDAKTKKLLDAIADKMKANPNYKVKVIGHPLADKVSQQKTYERIKSIIRYLVDKKGISENRFVFVLDGGSGDPNTIDVEFTTEDGPNSIPAPFPNLKFKN